MFNEDEYVDAGETPEVMTVEYGSCRFETYLYPRKNGGFDFFLFRDNSEFECLEIEKITWMRHQAPDGLLFIERFSDKSLSRGLRKKVEASFVKWAGANLGLLAGHMFRCRWGEE